MPCCEVFCTHGRKWRPVATLADLDDILDTNPTVSEIAFKTNLHGADLHLVAEHLRVNETVTAVDFSSTGLCDKEVAVLAEALEGNSTIAAVSFGENRIGDAGAADIADVIARSKTVAELYLAGNCIGDAGAVVIADALRSGDAPLVTLNLARNRIGTAGAAALVAAAGRHATLRAVDLRGNGVSPDMTSGIQAGAPVATGELWRCTVLLDEPGEARGDAREEGSTAAA